MMPALVLVALLADGPATGCEEVAAAGAAADPATAALYSAVGDDERAAGHLDAARAAYREALARDPDDAAARLGLAAACEVARKAASPPPDVPAVTPPPTEHNAFEEGLARMKQGDRPGAIAAFEAARAEGVDAAAALLEGICAYEQGDERRARPLFEEARAAPKLEGTALFFLGLVALHDDQESLASSLFDAAASSDARLATTAGGLGRLARRDGRLVASVLAETGYDSNVALAPDGTVTRTGAGDGYAASVAGLFWRPKGQVGPYARATAQYRKQLALSAYDLGDAGAAVGGRLGRGGRTLAGEYAYDFLSLGGAPYLSAHRLLAVGRAAFGPIAVGGWYAARFETFQSSAAAPYSGFRQEAEAETAWSPSAAAAVGAGYHLGADGTTSPELSYLEHGPFAILRLGIGGQARLVTEARLTFRRYDAVDQDLGVDRDNRYIDGALACERDLWDRWTVRLTGTARRAVSNVPDLQYWKLTAGLALLYTAGVR